MTQSDFWSEELPANHYQSQVSEKGLKIQGGTLPSSIVEFLTSLSQSGFCGKTSQASSVVVEDGILVPSLGRWRNSGMGSPTELWTLNTLEYPSAAVASSLSDILETGDVPQQYFLSATACQGILRRAEKRGKVLPSMLEKALRSTAQQSDAK